MITHPSAKKASYFLIFLEITMGISKVPGTSIILTLFVFGIDFKALLIRPLEIFL